MLAKPQYHKRRCKHFTGSKNDGDETTERPTCRAFPDGISREIAYGSDLHLTPRPGDGGITFEREK